MRRIFLSIAALLILGLGAAVALRQGVSSAEQNQKEQTLAPNTTQLHAHLREVSQWADSLKGMRVEQARKLFGTMQPKESTWKFEGKDQPLLAYEFPGYDLELYCLPERVVLVSIDLVVG